MVNTSKLRLTLLQQDILRLLFQKTGCPLNARAIAINLGVSQPAVSKALPGLETLELIKVERDKISGRLSIELKRDNKMAVWLKRTDNLKQIYESRIVELLYDEFPSSTIMLFGSYSFGEDTTNSDIDIAIIESKEKNLNLEKFEEKLQRPININYYKSFGDLEKHFLNNLLSGILLKGVIEI